MSQTTGTVRAKSDVLVSLTGQLSDPQNREAYAELVSYLKSLSPDDELVKVAQLLGFLTLMGRELPDALAKGQSELQEMLLKAHTAFQKLVETNAGYHQELNARLSKLPEEIAAGVKPEAIVKAMSESFRQQILKTGLQETQTLLSATASGLRTTAQALDAAVEPITTRYNDLAYRIETQAKNLDSQGNNLARTADTIQRKNAELVAEVRNVNWIWAATVGVVILLLGVFGGITWEQNNVADLIVNLQNQLAQLQQTIKAPAAGPAELPKLPTKHPKK